MLDILQPNTVDHDCLQNCTRQSESASGGCSRDVLGRDASYLAPPAQIRTSPIRAEGFYGAFFVKRQPHTTDSKLLRQRLRSMKSKLQGSEPSIPKILQSQNRPVAEKRLSINGLAVVHG